MSVWLQRRSDNIWVQLSISNYELINNSAVLTQAPNSTTYSQVEIRVADTPDELGSSQSEIAVLAGLYDEIVALNGIKNDITTVAGISGDVTTVSSNILDINSVATDIVPNLAEILQADTNATIATIKASEASASATSASNSATTATNQATIATTKASEASASEASALSSKNASALSETNAKTSETNAALSEANALAYKNSASDSATTATTQAGIATTKAEEASYYATITNYAIVETLAELEVLDTTQHNNICIVKDPNRGGTFIWSAAGTANGGTVFAGSTGYWNRQYSGDVNVKWFGAVGDGVTDDTVAIQKAIEAGFKIDMGDGFYIVSKGSSYYCLNIPSGSNIVGDTDRHTIKLKDDSSPCTIVRIEPYATNVRIKGLNLDGNRDNQTPAAGEYESYMGLIGSNNLNDIKIEDCICSNIYGRSFVSNQSGTLGDDEATYADDVSFIGCKVINGGTKSFVMRRTSNSKIINCTVDTYGVPDDGGVTNGDNCSAFEASNSRNIQVEACSAIHRNTPWGVTARVTNGSSNIIFNNIQGQGGRQFASLHGDDIILSNFIGKELGEVGVLIQSFSLDGNNRITISNGTLLNPQNYGVSVSAIDTDNTDIKVRDVNIISTDNNMLNGLRSIASNANNKVKYGGVSIIGETSDSIVGEWTDLNIDTYTFTPDITFETSGDLIVTHTETPYGRAWVQGKLVYWKIDIKATLVFSTSSGDIKILNLPFSANNEENIRGIGNCIFQGITSNTISQITPILVQGSNTIRLRASKLGGAIDNISTVHISSGSNVRLEMSGWYEKK